MSIDKENSEIKKSIKYGLPAFVIIMWFSSFWLIPSFIDEPESAGEMGDMFGLLNTLFSGLAFAGLIIAIEYQKLELQIQRVELQLQREELKTTNLELNKQGEQLENQSKSLIKQNFDSSFFRILELHNSILQDISIYGNIGRKGISRLNDEVSAEFNRQSKFNEELTTLVLEFQNQYGKEPDEVERIALELKSLQRTFSELLEIHLNDIGHYFNNLYHLVKYIDEAKGVIDNEGDYIRILRAQLSSDELCLLLYNCLSSRGTDFKPLVEKYSLLKNMDLKRLCSKELTNYFDPSAFV